MDTVLFIYYVKCEAPGAAAIKAKNLDSYFDAVESIAGVDRETARRELEAGRTIHTPHARFWAEPVLRRVHTGSPIANWDVKTVAEELRRLAERTRPMNESGRRVVERAAVLLLQGQGETPEQVM